MLPRIHTSQVIRRATKMFREHNQKCPRVARTRNTAGNEIEYNRRQGLIPESVTTTFHTILSEYISSYNHQRLTKPADLYSEDNLPPVWTNSKRIGKIARCEDRTVRNHLTLLRKFNLISTKRHGRDQNFELWVSPEFLFEKTAPIDPEAAFQADAAEISTEKFSGNQYKGHNKKTKGDADVHVLQGHDISQGHEEWTDQGGTSDEDAGANDKKPGCAAGGPAAGTPELVCLETGEVLNNPLGLTESAFEPVYKFDDDDFGKPVLPTYPDGKPIRRQLVSMIAQLWNYSKTHLYRGYTFKKSQEEKAAIAIRDGVYASFSFDLTDQEWEKFHDIQMEKAYRAARYLASHPTAYVPWPYSTNGSGKGYFDRENNRGFAGLDSWITKDRKQKRKKKKIDELKQARTDFEKQAAGKPLRKVVSGLDHQGLFAYYCNKFRSWGKIWEDRFIGQYERQKQQNFVSTVKRAVPNPVR